MEACRVGVKSNIQEVEPFQKIIKETRNLKQGYLDVKSFVDTAQFIVGFNKINKCSVLLAICIHY